MLLLALPALSEHSLLLGVHSTGARPDLLPGKDGTSRVMVVDFGGGTRDVALLQFKRSVAGGVGLSCKGVSRFHRTGGSDIDLAIAHEILLPQLMEQNGIKALDVDFRRKRDQLLPPLAVAAQHLKESLSNRIAHLQALSQFDENDPHLASSLPSPIEVNTKHPDFGVVKLTKPTLTLQELRKVSALFESSSWALTVRQGQTWQPSSDSINSSSPLS
nr:Hsp70 family protein [Cryobacterium suzukii]